jgi:RNA polymerase sigma-70 factor (ECF subfamily)
MDEGANFTALMSRVRAGDADAAASLVRQYEPEIRRSIRLRLTDPRLRRVLDSADVCQSVLANFFVRVAAGQFDLERPADLVRLLMVMARNRLRDHVSFHRAARRDNRLLEADPTDAFSAAPSNEPTPSMALAARDLLAAVMDGLDPAARRVAELRAAGHDWNAIATQLKERPDTLRKRLATALNRVGGQLGLDEVEHD